MTVADPEVDLFAGMKKKKKKQVVLDDTPEPESTAPEPAPVVDSRPEPVAAPAPAVAALELQEDAPEGSSGVATPAEGVQPVEDGGDLFADMKKKKKKKKEIPLDLVSGVV